MTRQDNADALGPASRQAQAALDLVAIHSFRINLKRDLPGDRGAGQEDIPLHIFDDQPILLW